MNYSLKPWNTFGISCYTNNLFCAESIQQLSCVCRRTMQYDQPVLILGEGSNVLFLEDFLGTVIINRIMGITISESKDVWHLHVGAGENWHKLVKFTLEKEMPGLENLALIPGCVGSSPIQNIGAYGMELKRVCEYVDFIELTTGKLQRFSTKECRFGYRDSIFKYGEYQGHIAIVTVGLRLHKLWQPILTYRELVKFNSTKVTPRQVFNTICHIRMSKLPNPRIYGNAGSFFKNPIVSNKIFQILFKQWPDIPCYPQSDGDIKLAAGWLIDKCQLKGIIVGGAAVHCRQASVLINKNKATSGDIIQLAHLVRLHVGKKFNIWLEPEVRFIGKTGEVNAVEIIT